LHLIDGVPAGNIAVLLRSVQVAATPIEQALASYGLRTTSSGDAGTGGEAATDVLTVLRLIDEVTDADIARVLTSQGIDPVQLLSAEIEPGESAAGLVERLGTFDPEIARIANSTLARVRALEPVTLPEQVYQAAVICGRLPPGEVISRDDYRYIQSLRVLLERSKEIAEAGGSRVDLIFELTTESLGNVPDDLDESAIQIMTVHAAKGLEFQHVFVANLAYGRFPLRRRLDRGLDLNQPESLHATSLDEIADDAERKRRFLEEERRLGYVALTRAIDHLYLSYARSYTGSASSHSVFVTDIGRSGADLLNPIKLSTVEEGVWNAAELARQQLEQIESALEHPYLSGDAIGDLLLAQWTLGELPGASTWRSRTEPFPHDGNESLRLSYSGLQTYETCPRRYYYGNVLRLPDDSTSAYALRGNILHNAIQWMNLQRRDRQFPELADLLGHLDSTWPADGFDSPAQERQIRHHCEQLLRRYHTYEQQQEREILGVELSLDARLGRHTVTGRIDCVSRAPDGTVEIIDFKSGKNLPTRRQQKLQLGIYQLAFTQRNPDEFPRAVICLLGNKEDSGGTFADGFDAGKQIRSLDFNQETIDKVTEEVLEVAGRILRNEFPTVTNSNTCLGCAYRNVCEGAREDV
jgi:ATP-dependent exoDNAse (exonuclease V) beta subunit